MDLSAQIAVVLERIREQNPLIHQITNYVTANDCANVTLAIGASPVMAHAIEEAAEMASLSNALLLNIGTLDHRQLPAMLSAGEAAAAQHIPIIFDPVGVGATKLRADAAKEIIRKLPLSVIRGNAAEIKLLAGFAAACKGVDALPDENSSDLPAVVQELSHRLDCVICATGARDIVADRNRLCLIDNGDPLLARITGSGCMSTSLIASCCAVSGDPFLGAICGLTAMGICGETARKNLAANEGLGNFRVRLLDAVSNLASEQLRSDSRLTFTAKEAASCRCAN